MKTIKTTLFTFATISLLTIAFQGCKKTVSTKKLDGNWKVTEATIKTTETKTESGTTTTKETNSTYDGIKAVTISADDTTEMEMTMDYTFDKKAGTYTIVTVTTIPEFNTNTGQYYRQDGSNYILEGSYERTTKRVLTTTESGHYTITGGAGEEIEENSQVTFQRNSRVEAFTDSYTYKVTTTGADLAPAGKFRQDAGSYVALETTDDGSNTETGANSQADIWNVVSIKKGVMNVTYLDESSLSNSDDNSTESSKTEFNFTLSEQK